tara:strand:- start:5888 stop:6070 length:183 start_codon:yes stop_codon:yes gene_type:complete
MAINPRATKGKLTFLNGQWQWEVYVAGSKASDKAEYTGASSALPTTIDLLKSNMETYLNG